MYGPPAEIKIILLRFRDYLLSALCVYVLALRIISQSAYSCEYLAQTTESIGTATLTEIPVSQLPYQSVLYVV